MQQLSSIEQSLSKLFKDVPHLPKQVREWLADNAWWLVLIGVIVGVLGALSLLSVLFFGSAVVSVLAGPVVGGALFIGGLVSAATLVVSVILEAMAIRPLKVKQKRGWDLLLLSVLVTFAGGVLGAIMSGNLGGILGPIVGAAIGCYVLFEVREYFAGAKKNA